MDELRLWITGLTTAAIIGAIVLVLAPGGGAEKTVKTMVSVFLVSSIVLPIAKNTDWKAETEFYLEENAAGTENSIAGEMAEQMKTKIADSVENILLKEGIQVHSVSIDIKTDGDELSVEKITVALKKASSQKVNETAQILEAQLGVNADVTIENSED